MNKAHLKCFHIFTLTVCLFYLQQISYLTVYVCLGVYICKYVCMSFQVVPHPRHFLQLIKELSLKLAVSHWNHCVVCNTRQTFIVMWQPRSWISRT